MTGLSTFISRRSTRIFVEEQEPVAVANGVTMAQETHRNFNFDGNERGKLRRQSRSNSTSSIDPRLTQMVDVGKDLYGILPKNSEEMGKQITQGIQAARASTNSKVDGRPVNFGLVVPGIYRSSFPQVEDFEYLKTLHLKTIVTLVKKDYPIGFQAFIKAHGIRHYVIDMQGTKKVEITQAVMLSIMKIVLDKENQPLLIHCNHGKHRTGCAAAVIRHVSCWNLEAILEEYKGYAEPKIRECDIKYITGFQASSLKGLFSKDTAPQRDSITMKTKMTRLFVATAIALAIWFTTLMIWQVPI